ncbi:MAG: hypothetical protein AB1668_05850 [Nanoarchaeota archaeon]
MSGLINKLSVPLFGLAAVVGSGCYDEVFPTPERTEPMVITEPGTYKVIPGDVFKGPLGVDLRVEEVRSTDEHSEGSILGSYIDFKGNANFNEDFSKGKRQIAFFRIRILAGEEQGTLKLTDKADDLYKNCIRLNELSGLEEECSIVSPTEALGGEVLVESPNGYFGKINTVELPELAIKFPETAGNLPLLATCAAMDLDTSIRYTGDFLGLPPLLRGAASIKSITENPPSPATSFWNVVIHYFKKEDVKGINTEIKVCEQEISEGMFARGDHEITHLFTRKISGMFPKMFEEGLANYVARKLNNSTIPWNEEGGLCFEEGFNTSGGEIVPYKKYNQKPLDASSVYSGECFWSKLVSEYGSGIIKGVVGELFRILDLDSPKPKGVEDQEIIFQQALLSSGVNLNDYQQWGLGE